MKQHRPQYKLRLRDETTPTPQYKLRLRDETTPTPQYKLRLRDEHGQKDSLLYEVLPYLAQFYLNLMSTVAPCSS